MPNSCPYMQAVIYASQFMCPLLDDNERQKANTNVVVNSRELISNPTENSLKTQLHFFLFLKTLT